MNTHDEDARARILVVEDDGSIRDLLRYFLGRHYHVELAAGVDEALEAASRTCFDVFFLDVNLGEMRSGIDLLGLLRQMPAYDATPALACSAYVHAHKRERFLQHGFDGCVGKPFKAAELRQAVEAVLADAARRAGQRLAA